MKYSTKYQHGHFKMLLFPSIELPRPLFVIIIYKMGNTWTMSTKNYSPLCILCTGLRQELCFKIHLPHSKLSVVYCHLIIIQIQLNRLMILIQPDEKLYFRCTTHTHTHKSTWMTQQNEEKKINQTFPFRFGNENCWSVKKVFVKWEFE